VTRALSVNRGCRATRTWKQPGPTGHLPPSPSGRFTLWRIPFRQEHRSTQVLAPMHQAPALYGKLPFPPTQNLSPCSTAGGTLRVAPVGMQWRNTWRRRTTSAIRRPRRTPRADVDCFSSRGRSCRVTRGQPSGTPIPLGILTIPSVRRAMSSDDVARSGPTGAQYHIQACSGI
jgi:hypothetical protein